MRKTERIQFTDRPAGRIRRDDRRARIAAQRMFLEL
jgi:hypothetical protein